MEEALVEEQQGVLERLEWVGARLDIVTIAGALEVSGEVVDSYLSGEQVYPEDEEAIGRLEQLEEMCETMAGLVDYGAGFEGEDGSGEGWVEEDDAMVIENVGVEGPVDQFGGGLGAVGVATGTGQGPVRPYRRLGDAPRVVKQEVPGVEVPEGDVGGDVVVGLDMDGDGKVDLPLPRAAVVPRKGTWTEDIEDRRQALWTARSIAQMTQGRLLKHKEMVAALSWVAEIELALISFYEDSVPDPDVPWDLERRTREINVRLERLRWAREEKEKEYGGVKGMMKWLVGDRMPSGKELYQKMVNEADRLLESVEIGNTGVSVVETVLKRQEMVADRRRQ